MAKNPPDKNLKYGMATKEGSVPEYKRLTGDFKAADQKRWLESWLKSPAAIAIARRNIASNLGYAEQYEGGSSLSRKGAPDSLYTDPNELIGSRSRNLNRTHTRIGHPADMEWMNNNEASAFYNPKNYMVALRPEGYKDAIPLHEYTHASTMGNKELLRSGNMEMIYDHNPIINTYFEDPTEVHARLTVLRKKLHDSGVKPDMDGRYDEGKIKGFLDKYRKKVKGDDTDNIIQLLDYQLKDFGEENETYKPQAVKELLENIVGVSPNNESVAMAKYGGKVGKYPFGGAVDEYNVLLNSFKNSDQSTWMSQLNEYGTRGGYNMNTTPEGLTQQGLDKMFAGYEAGVPKHMEQFKNENYNRIYEDHWNNASWWDQQFGRKKLKNEAVGLTEQQAQQYIGYDGNIRGNIQNQMGGIEGLMGLFGTFQNFMNPAQGDTFNPAQWFVNPTRGYKYGGGVKKYNIGGEINAPLEDQAPVPIQTEKGEVAAMPDGGIVDVKAKKKHKNMDDEEVTDILPPGSFVASDHKRMQFTKEDVEDTVFGFNPIEYNEDGATEAPKEYTAADIMTKKKMTPAEYLNVVKSKFKQTEREDDAFAQRAAEENLESRQPYIDAMINLTERKSPDTKTPKQAKYGYYIPNVQMQQIPKGMTEEDMSGLMGMGFQNGGKVGKYPWGAIVQGIATIASTITQANAAKRQRNDLIANYGDTISILDKAKGVQTNNLGLGTLAGAAGIMGQNPNVDAPVLDTRYVDALPQEMPRYMTDYAAQQINQASAPYINFAQRNAPSFNRGLNSLQGMQANQFNALSNLAVQRAQQNVGLRTNYLNQRGQLANQQITMNTDAVNKTRANRNVQIQNMGALGSNYFTGLNTLEANDAGNRITAGNVKATGQIQALQNQANANSMIPFAIAQAYNGTDWSKIFQNNNQQNTQSQINAPYIGTSFNNNGAGLYSNNLGKKWDPWASFGGG